MPSSLQEAETGSSDTCGMKALSPEIFPRVVKALAHAILHLISWVHPRGQILPRKSSVYGQLARINVEGH